MTPHHPKRCGKCGKKAMTLATVPYSVAIEHDGRAYRVEIPALTVPQFADCHAISIDDDADGQIHAAFRSEARLLVPEEIRHWLGKPRVESKGVCQPFGCGRGDGFALGNREPNPATSHGPNPLRVCFASPAAVELLRTDFRTGVRGLSLPTSRLGVPASMVRIARGGRTTPCTQSVPRSAFLCLPLPGGVATKRGRVGGGCRHHFAAINCPGVRLRARVVIGLRTRPSASFPKGSLPCDTSLAASFCKSAASACSAWACRSCCTPRAPAAGAARPREVVHLHRAVRRRQPHRQLGPQARRPRRHPRPVSSRSPPACPASDRRAAAAAGPAGGPLLPGPLDDARQRRPRRRHARLHDRPLQPDARTRPTSARSWPRLRPATRNIPSYVWLQNLAGDVQPRYLPAASSARPTARCASAPTWTTRPRPTSASRAFDPPRDVPAERLLDRHELLGRARAGRARPRAVRDACAASRSGPSTWSPGRRRGGRSTWTRNRPACATATAGTRWGRTCSWPGG